MIDLDAEYLAALSDTSPRRRRVLQAAGVSELAIALAGPAYTRVRPVGALLFEPNPDSDVGAWIVPARVLGEDTPEAPNPEAALSDGAIVDLVAFDPSHAAGWVLRTGNAEWLGSCPPQYLDPPPVALHRSPIDWLRADCRGLVCLARAPLDILRFLTRFATVLVASRSHAAELEALLQYHILSPTIVVEGE